MWVRLEFQALIFICALQLATCVAADANPAVNITWLKNNQPLLADGNGMSFFNYLVRIVFWCLFLWFSQWVFFVLFVSCVGISIRTSVLVDAITGLSTTSSTLEYSAKKEDTNAQFTCRTVEEDLVSQPVTFTITCESPNPAKHLYCFSLAYVINIVTQC